MKVLLAPQSFKGSLSVKDVCKAIRRGIAKYDEKIDIIELPVSDGGDGFLDVMSLALEGEIRHSRVTGPLGELVTVPWAISHKSQIAVIELAKVCGLTMVPAEQRNPLTTTTYGIGELIHKALDEGIQNMMIGLGGSATNDAGMGAAQALGARFLDINGHELPLGGGTINQLFSIDLSHLDPRLQSATITLACDVTNPLTGPEGASFCYSEQKGASQEVASQLENNFKHLHDLIENELSISLNTITGSGAAGGTGGGLHAFLGAKVVKGIDFVLDQLNFNAALDTVDVVITGEGQIDKQTAFDKAPIGVAKRAKAEKIPTVAIVGAIGEGYETVYEQGIDAIIPLTFLSHPDLPEYPNLLIEKAAEQVIRLLTIYLNH